MNNFVLKIKKFFLYLWEKRNEVKKLDLRDLKQANIIAQIELFREEKKWIFVNLEDFIFFHPIDRKSALKKLKKRIKILKKNKKKFINKITKKEIDKIVPSITPIKVIKINNKFLIWEGNGRVMAFKKVFEKNFKIEVLEFKLDNFGEKIVKKLYTNLTENEKN